MNVSARNLLVAVLLTAGASLLTVRPATAQFDGLPPAPVPLPPPPPPGGAAVLGTPVPAPAPPVVVPPAPGPAQPVDPFSDLGLQRPAGFFAGLELQFLGPSLKQRLRGNVVFPDGSTDTVSVPQADLDWTVAPRFELGYLLKDGDAFLFGYRFLNTDGRTTLSSDQGDFFVRSRLTVNQVDLDYRSAPFSPLARYTIQWRLGARILSTYFDSRIENDFFAERATNYFYGGGPHGTIDFERRFQALPELGVFARLDGAVAIGEVTQRFGEAFVDGQGNVVSASSRFRRTEAVPMFLLQAGLTYHPLGPAADYLRFTLGYQYEHWWDVGRLGDSRGDLTMQGVFFRGEIDF